MTDEERKALVEWLWDQAGFACEKAEQVELTNAADQIEADGQRIAELEAALQLLHDNIVHAWPAVADLGPVASARAALGDKG